MDKVHNAVDRKILTMERKLSSIYSRADKEVMEKVNAYFKNFERLDAEKLKLLNEGKITRTEYKTWRRNKVMTGTRWTDLKNTIAKELLHTNEVAVAYINNQIPSIYVDNYNYGLKGIQQEVKGYSFDMVDEYTVKNLAKSNRTLLPYKIVDGKKDVRWNTKRVNSEVLQGILQGESIPDIAKRLQKVTAMNKVSAIRNARTTATSAENKGRIDSYKAAEKKGLILKKVWIATVDDRTRAWHSDLDGVAVDVDDYFENDYGKIRYPADPEADPANVYNCRCTLKAKVVGFK